MDENQLPHLSPPQQPQPPLQPLPQQQQQPGQLPQQPLINNPPPNYQQPMQQQQQGLQHQTDTLGIISIVMAFISLQLIGLILGIVGLKKANKEGYPNTLSKIGIILNAVILLLIVPIIIILVMSNFSNAQTKGRDTVANNNLNTTYLKLEEFYNSSNYYPESLEELRGAPSDIDPVVLDTVISNERYNYSPEKCKAQKCQFYTISYDLENKSSNQSELIREALNDGY